MGGADRALSHQGRKRGGFHIPTPFFGSSLGMRKGYLLHIRAFHMGHLVAALLIAFLALFVLFPVAKVFVYPSLKDYAYILSRPRSIRALKNSLFITFLSTISTTILGFLFAYAMNYTAMPGKRFFRAVLYLPLLSPPFVVALSWILLFGTRGLISYQLLGARWNIFGWRGLWMVQTIAFFPYTYLIIDGVLRRIDPSMEYAAKNLGASGTRVFWTVTLPLALPGIVNAALLVAIYVLADFGNPIVIAGDWPVLPTTIYGRIAGHYDLSGAAALSTILMVPALVLFFLARWTIRKRSFVTITGRGITLSRPLTGKTVQWCLFSLCSFVTVLILAVYGTLVAGAFTKTWGLDWSFTLKHWSVVLSGPSGKSLTNSLIFALLAGAGGAAFSLVASYFIYKGHFATQRFWDFSVLLPAAIPGIFLGIGFLLAFNAPPLILSGTTAIIILALLVWNIPLGYQTCTAALEQIGSEIAEAASNLGATPIRAFATVVAPLLRGPFVSGFTMGFLRSITNLSIVIFLIGPGRTTATVQALSLIQYAELGPAVALTVALFAIAIATVGLASLLTRGQISFLPQGGTGG